MTKVNLEENIYIYGKYEGEQHPLYKKSDMITIFAHPLEASSPINSLEGFFISRIPLVEEGEIVNKEWQLNLVRKEMKWAEDRDKGEFFPFEK